MATKTDRNDLDRTLLPDGQQRDHLVLPEERRTQNVRPVREQYVHLTCGATTRMPLGCAETYAANPSFYSATFCCRCGGYFPVGADGEFVWADARDQKVGT